MTAVDPTPCLMSSRRLTAHETAIVVLMAGGQTTPEIASLLDLRARTVENHKRHIYEKLGVGTRNGAVAEAAKRGLLTCPGSRPWPGEPGRPMLVLLYGQPGGCRDSVVHTLVADGVPFVSVRQRDGLERDHWAEWHRGIVLTVLVDPEPEDWAWAGTLQTPVVVVRAARQRERFAVVDALAHRANGLLCGEDVPSRLTLTLRAAADGLFTMSLTYTNAMSTWSPPEQEATPELTPREQDILGSIALGHTVRQTARTLGIATKTVENIQARLFRKLGARNRAETLAIARNVGLVRPVN